MRVPAPTPPLQSSAEQRVYEHPDIRKLLAVYHNQTGEEKGNRTAKYKNSLGFNRVDAPVLTPIAEHFLEKGFVWSFDLEEISFRIGKYHRQWKTDAPPSPADLDELPF